jgi:hypothetical protein
MPAAMIASRDLFGLGHLFPVLVAVIVAIFAWSLGGYRRFNCPSCGKWFYGPHPHRTMKWGPKPACCNCGIRVGTPKFALIAESGASTD